MTYAEKIKERVFGRSSLPVNAVIYARVSTDKESQKDSCANQVDLALRFTETHTNVNIIDTYVDDGISGKNDDNRPEYNRMLELVDSGKVDLIITKSTSRLNRDSLNSLSLASKLIATETTILTLEDFQIHDFEDLNSDLLHSLNFAIDALFVKKQSLAAKKTHELRCQRKELSAKDTVFGYDWDSASKTITINEQAADIVREVFEKYVYHGDTPSDIYKDINRRGISLCERSVTNILQDERYIGRFFINKSETKLGTGKRKSKKVHLPKEKWILIERPDLVIVDHDLFEMAQRLRETRKNIYIKPDKEVTQAYFKGTHLFSAKVFCAVCGKPYSFDYADRNKTIPVYRIRRHSDCLNSYSRLRESDLIGIVKTSLTDSISNQISVCNDLEKLLEGCLKESNKDLGGSKKLKSQLDSLKRQRERLIDTIAEDDLTDDAKRRVKERLNSLCEQIKIAESEIADKDALVTDESYISETLSKIKAAINDLKLFKTIDRKRVENYVDRIEVYPNGDINLILRTLTGINLLNNNVGKMRRPDARSS